MSKLNERLTLIANLSVIAGVVILAVEMQQNTQAIQAQTRDSMTAKQMLFTEWIGTNPEVAELYVRGNAGGLDSLLVGAERTMYLLLVQGNLREWENSHYQFERGLFSQDDFQPRLNTWRVLMATQGYRQAWGNVRERFAPRFRDELDRIVTEVASTVAN